MKDKEQTEEELPVKIVKKEVEPSFAIQFKVTKNKQVLVEGTPNKGFIIIDKSNSEEVGRGTTNQDGKAICVCRYVNDKIKAQKL